MLEQFFFLKHLDDDEAAVRIVHRHWGVGSRALAWPTALFLAGWLCYAVAPVPLVLLFAAVASVWGAAWWMRNFFDYYLDVWIITDHGIIDLKWEGWFHRQSTRILYSDIQGVSYEIKGIMDTLANCGSVTIEKISTGTAFSMSDVHDPKSVETVILEYMERYLHSKNLKNAKHVQDLLAEFVAEKMQLQDVSKQKPERKKGMVTRKL